MKWFWLLLVCLQISCVPAELVTFAPGKNGALGEQELAERRIQGVDLKTSDNVNIHVLYLPNEQTDVLTIYFHGNGGNIHQRSEVLEYIRSLGSGVLGVSYRGYLNSDGTPSEKGIYKDARAALEYATNTLGYAKENIVLLGRSLGSGVAIELAQNENFAGVVLVTPFSNPRDMLLEQNWLMRLLVKNSNNYLDTAFQNSEKVKSITSFVLVVHGTADEVVPYSQGRQLYDAVPGDKLLVTINGAQHNNFGFSDSSDFDKQYWAAIAELLNRIQK